MKKEKIFTKAFILNTLICFIFYNTYYILTASIATYASKTLHQSAGIGLSLASIFVVGALIGRLWTGVYIVKYGMKRVLYFGAALFFILTFGYFLTTNIPLLFLIRTIQGVGFGIGGTAVSTIIGYIVPESRRGEGIGYFALSVTIAAGVGPALSIMIYTLFGFDILLWLAAVLLAIAFVLVFFFKIKELTPDEAKYAMENSGKGIKRFIEFSALPISIVTFLAGFIDSSIITGMGDFSTYLNIPLAGSLFFTLYAIFILISRPFTGRLFDLKGDNYVFHPTFILFALSMATVGLAGFFNAGVGFVLLLIAGAFFGLSYGGIAPFGHVIAIRDAEPHRLGVATSTFFAALDLGVGGGPFILGPLIPMLGHGMFGFRNLYLLSAPAVVILWVIYWFIHGRKQTASYKQAQAAKNKQMLKIKQHKIA